MVLTEKASLLILSIEVGYEGAPKVHKSPQESNSALKLPADKLSLQYKHVSKTINEVLVVFHIIK